MKLTRFVLVGAGVAALTLSLGMLCLFSSCSGPPRRGEAGWLDPHTNRVPVVELVSVTNDAGRIESVLVTNVVEQYSYTPGTNAARATEIARGVGGLFGIGELLATIAGGAFGLWGVLRSQQSQKTATVLAQVIETGRQALQTTAEGRKLDQAWKQWMISHQAQTGVIENVAKLVSTAVDEPTARVVAGQLVHLINRDNTAAS